MVVILVVEDDRGLGDRLVVEDGRGLGDRGLGDQCRSRLIAVLTT